MDELYLITVEIETVLNCRPIVPLESLSDDVEVLTPGHFLIGKSLKSVPAPDLSRQSLNRVTRWNLQSDLFVVLGLQEELFKLTQVRWTGLSCYYQDTERHL